MISYDYYGWDPPEGPEPGGCCDCYYSDCRNCEYFYDFDWNAPEHEELDPDGHCLIGCTCLTEPE